MKITLSNNFHNTEATANVKSYSAKDEYIISKRTARRLRRELCGSKDCTCGDTFGARPNRIEIYQEDADNYRIGLI